MSPFDSLLEFLLNLIPIFSIHRIEDELFARADENIIAKTFGRWPRIFMMDFLGF